MVWMSSLGFKLLACMPSIVCTWGDIRMDLLLRENTPPP